MEADKGMNKKEQAIALHDKGYNCCQAVACSFAQDLGYAPEIILKAAEGFGLGMGCMDGNCGALSGAVMLAGLKNADGNTDTPMSKGTTYKLSREIYRRFTEKTGSSICRELKGADTGRILCSCPDCIRAGVEAAQEVLGL